MSISPPNTGDLLAYVLHRNRPNATFLLYSTESTEYNEHMRRAPRKKAPPSPTTFRPSPKVRALLKRARQRGFNQSQVINLALAKSLPAITRKAA